jgi:phosphate transport system substrate-binding protein
MTQHIRTVGVLLVRPLAIAGLLLVACGPVRVASGPPGSPTGDARTLTGAGATFPAVLYTKWFHEYERLTGVKVNYQAIGSGGGIKSLSDRTVDFGATDAPMSDAQLQGTTGGEVLHIPMALGAVAVTYHLPQLVEPLQLTPETLVAIYLGAVTKWNDPQLVAQEPRLANVDRSIVVVHRSDGSGTTYIFTDYLASVSATWKQRVGVGTSIRWPVGLGAKGNEGIAGEVKQTPYSIGYVELVYALQNKLAVGLVRNQAGTDVEPTIESTEAAAAAASLPPDLRASIVNAPGENAYPIVGFTWQLVYREIPNTPKAKALTRLLWWEIHEAQTFNAALGYAPLPADVVRRAEGQVRSITSGGQPAFPGA